MTRKILFKQRYISKVLFSRYKERIQNSNKLKKDSLKSGVSSLLSRIRIPIIPVILAYLLLILGFLLVFKTFYIFDLIIQDGEYPVGDVKGIVVDSEDRIYLGLYDYDRIQVYDKNGVYLRSWGFSTRGGVFRIAINEFDNIYVASVRGSVLYIFDSEGRLLSKTENKGLPFYKKFGKGSERWFVDSSGNQFEVEKSFFSTKIIKNSPSGEKSIVVSSSFQQWVLLHSGALLILFGMVMGVLTSESNDVD